MSLMKSSALVALLCVLAIPTAASAQGDETVEIELENNGPDDFSGFHLATNLGVSKFFDGGPVAFGLDVFPGYALGNGLILEGHVGIHAGGSGYGYSLYNFDGRYRTGRSAYVPFMFGARYQMDFGPIRAFVASHIGPTFTSNYNWRMCNGNCSAARLAFDVGSGAEYVITDQIGVGGAFWYHLIGGSERMGHMFNFGAHASFRF